jgi:hypothetical protein
LRGVDDRLGKLEKAILDDPEKALSIPILRNDIAATKTAYGSEMNALRGEIARIYDLNKWFVGLMFSMALGIIGLAITNVFKTK